MSRIERRQFILESREREQKIEVMLLRGEKNLTRIAAALGCSRRTATRHEVRIRRRWARRTLEEREALIQESTAQLNMIIFTSMDGFTRSKQDIERVMTSYKPTRCPSCGGRKDSDCQACGGTGRIMTTVETREIKGSAGNPAFLKAALDALKERNNIHGLHINKTEIDVTLKAMIVTMETQPSEKLDALINLALDVRRENLAMAE